MGDTTTAMRDPIFYRWHGFVDSLFGEFKYSLTPYTQQQVIALVHFFITNNKNSPELNIFF